MILDKNIKLTTIDGKAVELIGSLHEGTHSSVYKVVCTGEAYILKWGDDDCFRAGSWYYRIIENLIELYKPFEVLLNRPLSIVIDGDSEKNYSRFGYLISVIPENYRELNDYFRCDSDLRAVRFLSYNAQLNAAIMIVSFIQMLHLRGLSMNIEPEDILVNGETGDTRIINSHKILVDMGTECDSDNRAFHIAYLAPEIPRNDFKLHPSMETDRYALAVVLYRLFFIDHPMEGKKWKSYPLPTFEIEKSLYSTKPVFHLDPNDDSNRPSEYFAPNVMERWASKALYTRELRETFIKVFTEGIDEPTKRPSELEWMSVISQARERLINIDKDHEQFVDFENPLTIPNGCMAMKIGNKCVALYPLKEIYGFTLTGDSKQYANVDGEIVYDKQIDKLTMRNLTDQIWRCYSPQTKQLTDLSKGQDFPLEPGAAIEFRRKSPKIIGKIFDPLK